MYGSISRVAMREEFCGSARGLGVHLAQFRNRPLDGRQRGLHHRAGTGLPRSATPRVVIEQTHVQVLLQRLQMLRQRRA